MDGESGTADSRSAALPLPCMCLLVSRGGRGDARVRAYCRRLDLAQSPYWRVTNSFMETADTVLLIDSERFWGPFQRVLPSKFKHTCTLYLTRSNRHSRRAQHDACATKLTLSGERHAKVKCHDLLSSLPSTCRRVWSPLDYDASAALRLEAPPDRVGHCGTLPAAAWLQRGKKRFRRC